MKTRCTSCAAGQKSFPRKNPSKPSGIIRANPDDKPHGMNTGLMVAGAVLVVAGVGGLAYWYSTGSTAASTTV